MLTPNKAEITPGKQSGATLVEAAVVFPVVMFLLFGIIQWGLIFCAQITVTNAAATAGRIVAGQSVIFNSGITANTLIDAARNSVDPFLIPANLGVTVVPTPFPTLNGTNTVTITCTYNYPLLLKYVVPGQVNGSLQITSTTSAR